MSDTRNKFKRFAMQNWRDTGLTVKKLKALISANRLDPKKKLEKNLSKKAYVDFIARKASSELLRRIIAKRLVSQVRRGEFMPRHGSRCDKGYTYHKKSKSCERHCESGYKRYDVTGRRCVPKGTHLDPKYKKAKRTYKKKAKATEDYISRTGKRCPRGYRYYKTNKLCEKHCLPSHSRNKKSRRCELDTRFSPVYLSDFGMRFPYN